MTVEERAHQLITKIFSLPSPGSRDRQVLAPLIMEFFRDQIEDCAKIADKHKKEFEEGCWRGQCEDRWANRWANQACLMIANDIRALVRSTTTTIEERKESER